jgi:hypothetical protein
MRFIVMFSVYFWGWLRTDEDSVGGASAPGQAKKKGDGKSAGKWSLIGHLTTATEFVRNQTWRRDRPTSALP